MPRPVDYRASDHISPERYRDAYARPAFPLSNRIKRQVWNIVWALLFRTTPRPMHAWRAALLRLFGARLGADCHVYAGCRVWAPWNLIAEDHFAAGDGVEIYNPSPMYFESHVILSQGAYICGATHDYNDPEFPLMSLQMRFGAYAWICARACVAPGVAVGEGAVLGLAGVATRDMEPWTVYGGNPAVALRPRERHAVQEEAIRAARAAGSGSAAAADGPADGGATA